MVARIACRAWSNVSSPFAWASRKIASCASLAPPVSAAAIALLTRSTKLRVSEPLAPDSPSSVEHPDKSRLAVTTAASANRTGHRFCDAPASSRLTDP